MRGTIDRAGRVVLPKQLRDQLGLRPGPMEIEADGAGFRIEPVVGSELVERDGRLMIPTGEFNITDDVRALRFADQQ